MPLTADSSQSPGVRFLRTPSRNRNSNIPPTPVIQRYIPVGRKWPKAVSRLRNKECGKPVVTQCELSEPSEASRLRAKILDVHVRALHARRCAMAFLGI